METRPPFRVRTATGRSLLQRHADDGEIDAVGGEIRDHPGPEAIRFVTYCVTNRIGLRANGGAKPTRRGQRIRPRNSVLISGIPLCARAHYLSAIALAKADPSRAGATRLESDATG